MKTARLALLIVAGAAVLTSGQILADQEVRHVPERDIPVPATVSPAEQTVIARPLSPIWNEHPKSAAEWKVLIARLANGVVVTLPELRQRLGVKVEPTVIGGVKAYVVTPESIPETNRNRLLVHVHGGGYVFFPGEAGTREAILMAGYSGMKVISVDYRMPPDFPYPAALDDAMAVWKEESAVQFPAYQSRAHARAIDRSSARGPKVPTRAGGTSGLTDPLLKSKNYSRKLCA